MKYLLFTIILALLPAALLAADFNAGMMAYERQNYAAAVSEFSPLAENGDPHAQYMLGRLHERGSGTVQDYVQAHKWYNLAAARGHSHAAQARDTIAGRMPSAQIFQAQRMARQWQPQADLAKVETPSVTPHPRQMTHSIQEHLNELGYNAGVTDGWMGANTRAAIRNYQTDHGIAVDGRPSQALLAHLTETLRTGRIQSGTPEPLADNWPWRRLLLHDSFRDGDYSRDPTWTVGAGRFSVESATGLRTVHEPRQPVSASEGRHEDFPMAILGAILGEVNRSRGSAVPAAAPDLAEIYVQQTITNAFAIQLDLTVRQATGPLLFGPYQNDDRSSGYHLVYTPDVARGLHLVRLTGFGSSIIESVDRQLSLNRQYAIQWTRDRSGEMVVSLDNDEIFRVSDRGFADPFDGFTLINKGGDYSLREITIHGVN